MPRIDAAAVEKLAPILGWLSEAFPKTFQPLTETTLVWADLFGDLPPEQLWEAARRVAKYSDYCTTAAMTKATEGYYVRVRRTLPDGTSELRQVRVLLGEEHRAYAMEGVPLGTPPDVARALIEEEGGTDRVRVHRQSPSSGVRRLTFGGGEGAT